jgi:hypothetical protein
MQNFSAGWKCIFFYSLGLGLSFSAIERCIGQTSLDRLLQYKPEFQIEQCFGLNSEIGVLTGRYEGGGSLRTVKLRPGVTSLAILGDTLDLGQIADIEIECAKNSSLKALCIIANKLIISRSTVIKTSSKEGVDCSVIAREIVVGRNAALEIDCTGQIDWEPASVGHLKLCAERVFDQDNSRLLIVNQLLEKIRDWEQQPFFTTDPNGGLSAAGFIDVPPSYVWASLRRSVDTDSSGNRIPLPGSLATDIETFQETTSGNEFAPAFLYGVWKIGFLEQLHLSFSEAIARQNVPQGVQLVRRVKGLPDWPTDQYTTTEVAALYGKLSTAMQELKDTPILEIVPVGSSGSKNVPLVIGGADLELEILPTDLYIIQQQIGGREYPGVLTFERNDDSAVFVTLLCAMDVGDKVKSALSKKLGRTFERIASVSQSFAPKTIADLPEGIRSVKFSPSGRNLQVVLSIDPARATTTLFQLSTPSGLTFPVEWSPISNRGKSIVSSLTVSIVKRWRPSISSSEEYGIRNEGNVPISVAYFKCGDSIAVPVDANEIVLKPSETASFDRFELIDALTGVRENTCPAIAEIGPDGIHSQLGKSPLQDFKIADGLLDVVTIENKIPSYDSSRNTILDYVECTCTIVGNDTADTVEIGPFKLNAEGIPGSTISLPRLKSVQISNYILSGKANYRNGSDEFSKKFSGDSTSIYIDSSMLDVQQ